MFNRQVVVRHPDEWARDVVVDPVPADGEVRVRSRFVGVCESDIHMTGEHTPADKPFWPGHELVGRIDAVGPGVAADLVGKRVTVEPTFDHGHCKTCLAGSYSTRETLAVFGYDSPGAMPDSFTVPADRVIALPDDLTELTACLVQPLATPVHAVRRAGDLRGRRVFIIGAGPIGLLTAFAARQAGAACVVMADLAPSKRERAARLGADGVLDPASESVERDARAFMGARAHVLFDCVSTESTVRLATRLLEQGGAVQFVVAPAGPAMVDLDLIQHRELSLWGNLKYTRQDIEIAISLLRAHQIDVAEIIPEIYDVDEVIRSVVETPQVEQV